jgi:hypothetical protein
LAHLLGADAALADSHKLYRCHDRLLAAQSGGVRSSGGALGSVHASFDVLLYDLTSSLSLLKNKIEGNWVGTRRLAISRGSTLVAMMQTACLGQ